MPRLYKIDLRKTKKEVADKTATSFNLHQISVIRD